MSNLQNSQPYFIYRRLILTKQVEYFLFDIDYGFNYLLRNINVRFPEIDSTGAVYGPTLNFESIENSVGRRAQNEPIPFNLLATPGSSGVSVNGSGQMTSASLKNKKMLNVAYPYRDTIQFKVSGQDGITPVAVDIVLIGYLVAKGNIDMWGNNDTED